jgi:hypothetical protein
MLNVLIVCVPCKTFIIFLLHHAPTLLQRTQLRTDCLKACHGLINQYSNADVKGVLLTITHMIIHHPQAQLLWQATTWTPALLNTENGFLYGACAFLCLSGLSWPGEPAQTTIPRTAVLPPSGPAWSCVFLSVLGGPWHFITAHSNSNPPQLVIHSNSYSPLLCNSFEFKRPSVYRQYQFMALFYSFLLK